MKVMKAMKKLKFWSRKKKKKKNQFLEQPPPPYYCHHQYYTPFEPSAPPLPPWMDYEQPHERVIIPEIDTVSGSASSSRASFGAVAQDSVPEIGPSCPTDSASTSYQQYMIPNPGYDVPDVSEVRKERAGGAVGCVISVGVHFIRCFFPCFHIRESR